MPNRTGLLNGVFVPCNQSSDCVSSQENNDYNKVDFIAYTGDRKLAIDQLIKSIESLPKHKIITRSPDYLFVEFSSSVLGWVDNFEAYFPETQKIIHLKSASRIRLWDFGSNRKRIYEIIFYFVQKHSFKSTTFP